MCIRDRSIQASISTSPVSCCWAMAAISPRSLNLSAPSTASTVLGSTMGGEPGEAALQIGDQIVGILEPGVDAQQRPFALPFDGRADRLGGDDEAFEPAPARA